MSKEKLWCECSKEEHSEIRNWNKRRKQNIKDFENGMITQRQYKLRVNKLSKELDEIERKYDDSFN